MDHAARLMPERRVRDRRKRKARRIGSAVANAHHVHMRDTRSIAGDTRSFGREQREQRNGRSLPSLNQARLRPREAVPEC